MKTIVSKGCITVFSELDAGASIMLMADIPATFTDDLADIMLTQPGVFDVTPVVAAPVPVPEAPVATPDDVPAAPTALD